MADIISTLRSFPDYRLIALLLLDFRNDAKFKKYQSAIEKTLQTFESIGEWADIISFLNRLSKVLHTHTSPYALMIFLPYRL